MVSRASAVGCHRLREVPSLHGTGRPPSAVAARNQSVRFWAYWDGTVMEQRGRNRWQTFGSPKSRKSLDLAPNRCQRCHGKEGVDGSSPSEGFAVYPAISGPVVVGLDAVLLFRRPPSVH